MSAYQMLIGGKMVDGDLRMDVINPATEQVITQCPRASLAQLDDAVAAARAAFPAWAATSMDGRRDALLKAAEAIEAGADELARILTQEQGKPLAAALEEVFGAAAFFRFFASMDLHTEVLADDAARRVEVRYRPLGVVGAIVPWNYPLILAAFKIPPALLAGNTIVVKPAGTTPLATLHLARLLAPVFPAGVFNVIADANDLGAEMTRHAGIDKISFTGSTATGAKVMAGAAATLKRVTLELGGNDAAIVLDDADVKAVAPRLFASAFTNSGQVCIAVKRLYVPDALYDALCSELAALADAAVVGNGLEEGTQFGPLQNRMQFERVKELLDDARRHGRVIAGGQVAGPGEGFFIRPTIVRDIADGTRLVDEEQFGPVLPVIRYGTLDDAIARVNASPYGLGGSVWSSDVERARTVAERVESGTVWVNKHLDLTPDVPFAGCRQSGVGTELGLDGLREFTQRRVINIAK
jgi:acyl-CoA reductase-like NAD-dependent aldehyde dehydrogenase